MKNLFIQIKQWVLKHRKKLIYGALALFIFQIGFFSLGGISNQVFAEGGNTPTTDSNFHTKATDWITKFSFFKIVIYVFIYPILIIAGILVDNSLVYAEVFGFDSVLWKLWTIARNLANYGLGFVFVFKVFQSLIVPEKSSKWIEDILKPTLIAGIGIQASWFVMSVLIDISTVVTYGVGGLPITILGSNITEEQNSSENNPYVYQTLIYFDGENPDEFDLFLSNTQSGSTSNEKFYISKCRLFTYSHTGNEGKETLILGPKYIYYKTNNVSGVMTYFPISQDICHNDNKVYQFSVQYVARTNPTDQQSGAARAQAQSDYDNNVNLAISQLSKSDANTIVGLIQAGKILQIGDAHGSGGIMGPVFKGIEYSQDQPWGQDVNNQRVGSENDMRKLDDVLNIDGGSYVSVFNTLYSSLLHAGEDLRVSESVSDSTYVRLLNEILGMGHALAIAMPLVGMAIVFMMRIGILWVAIAMSPFIVLLTAYGWGDDVLKGDILKYFNVKNLVMIIFSPAIVCFSISLSTVLVRIIMALNWQKVITNDDAILGGLVRLDIAGLGVNLGKMLCAVIGVAITWFLVWAAVQSSELGKSSIIKSIKETTQTALGSIPLVPIPTKDGNVQFIGANAAFGLNGVNGNKGILTAMSDKIKEKYSGNEEDIINDLTVSSRVEGRLADSYKDLVGSHTFTSDDWTTEEVTINSEGRTKKVTFRQLPGNKQEEIIEAINALDQTKRANFKTRIINIKNGDNNVIYELDGNNQYQKK